MFVREKVYYLQNNSTGDQKSLRTKDKQEAKRLLEIHNAAGRATALNLELGRAYLRAADPKIASRTWQAAMDELSSHGIESTQTRCRREMRSKAYDLIREKPIVETTREDLKAVLKRGGRATNHYLHRLHNLAVGNGWINWPTMPPTTAVFGDSLGLPKAVDFYTDNAQPVCRYRVVESTNVIGWNFPLHLGGNIHRYREPTSDSD